MDGKLKPRRSSKRDGKITRTGEERERLCRTDRACFPAGARAGKARDATRALTPEFTKMVHNHPLLERFLRWSMGVLFNIGGNLRIQLEFGHLTNMSVAAITKSGQLALQATLSGSTHATSSQDR